MGTDRFWAVVALALVAAGWAESAGGEEQGEGGPPEKYVLEYPRADRFCPPIQSTFYEVTRTWMAYKGKRFRQKPNGGYGLPVVDKVGDRNLLHVGADLGWHRVGEPVFAVAAGVVRLSTGPDFRAQERRGPPDARSLPWGNFVVIEHRLGDDEYVTTLYGHLGPKRLVRTGDVVAAGQPLGTIGRQHARINGGYQPHLHFGVLEGRQGQPGCVLLRMRAGDRPVEIKLKSLGEERIELELPAGAPERLSIALNGRPFELTTRAGETTAPATLLWHIHRPDFPLVGYALSTDGFLDPVRFLRRHRADVAPAPYRQR